jgi:hypothetical protein
MRCRDREGYRVSIYGLHIPYDETVPVAKVLVNQRTVTSYYPYTQRGPAEAGRLNLDGVEVNAYVNSRYSGFGVEMVNKRVTVLFAIAGTGMWGGAVRGDALLIGPSDRSGYETSLSPDFLEFALTLDWSAFTEHVETPAH